MAPSTTLGGQLPARAEKPHPGGHTGSEAEKTDLRVHTAEAARSDFRPFAAPVLMMLDAEVGSTVWADVAMALMLDLRLPDVVFAAAAVRMMPALSSIFPVIGTNCCERNFQARVSCHLISPGGCCRPAGTRESSMSKAGLDNRHRNKDGEISSKHGNTLIRTLRKIYGQSFAAGYPETEKLSEVLLKLNETSLSQLRRDHETDHLEHKIAKSSK